MKNDWDLRKNAGPNSRNSLSWRVNELKERLNLFQSYISRIINGQAMPMIWTKMCVFNKNKSGPISGVNNTVPNSLSQCKDNFYHSGHRLCQDNTRVGDNQKTSKMWYSPFAL